MTRSDGKALARRLYYQDNVPASQVPSRVAAAAVRSGPPYWFQGRHPIPRWFRAIVAWARKRAAMDLAL